jgi:hypothetical protein
MSRVPKELFVLHHNELESLLFSQKGELVTVGVMQHKGGPG